MQSIEAAKLIESIVESIRGNPTQFSVNITSKVVGMQGTAGPGGNAIVGTAYGGAPGSSATGISSSVHGGNQNYDVVQDQQISQAQGREIEKLVRSLEDLVAELKKPKPKKSAFELVIGLVKKMPIAGWITGVLEFLRDYVDEIQEA